MMRREDDVDTSITSTMEVSEQSVDPNVEASAETSDEVVAQKDPVEEAAQKFTELLPYVRKIADSTVSKGSLVRVLHAYAEFPLGNGKPRLLNQQEQLLFNIMQELQGYKSTVLQDFMKKNLAAMQMEKLLNEKETVHTESQTSEPSVVSEQQG